MDYVMDALSGRDVEDYQRFGVIVTDGRGHMTKIVEKPDTPVSKLANIGLYYVRDWRTLFDGIAHVLAQPPNKGEFYLTDAFQFMVEQGRRLLTARVTGWYDCGKVDTLLETNRHLLQRGRALPPAAAAARGCTIVPPRQALPRLGVGTVAGGHEHLHVRPHRLQQLEHSRAPARQHHVEDHEVHRRVRALRRGHGGRPVHGLEHTVPEARERALQRGAHDLLIVHDQHGPADARRSGRHGGSSGGGYGSHRRRSG